MCNWTRSRGTLVAAMLLTACSNDPGSEKSNRVDNDTANNANDSTNVVSENADPNNVAVVNIYAPAGTFALGQEAMTPVVANLDGDAFVDVVVVNQFSADTQLFLGDGAGGFRVDGDTYGRAVAAVAADFDGNGLDDIAMSVDGEPRVEVVLNPGDVPFQISLEVDDLPDGLTTADFDGDGDTDLAVAIAGNLNEPAASVAIFPWGENTFESPSLAAVGLQPRKLATLDDDIVVLLGTKAALVLDNNGSGTFAASAPFGVGDGVLEFTLVDINASGALDMVSADLSGGIISAAVDIPGEDAATLTEVAAPFGITTLHANDDEVLDLAITSVDDQSVIGLLSRPDGKFSPVVLAEIEGATRLGGLVAADIDGDGIDDLLVVERNRDASGTLHVFVSGTEE